MRKRNLVMVFTIVIVTIIVSLAISASKVEAGNDQWNFYWNGEGRRVIVVFDDNYINKSDIEIDWVLEKCKYEEIKYLGVTLKSTDERSGPGWTEVLRDTPPEWPVGGTKTIFYERLYAKISISKTDFGDGYTFDYYYDINSGDDFQDATSMILMSNSTLKQIEIHLVNLPDDKVGGITEIEGDKYVTDVYWEPIDGYFDTIWQNIFLYTQKTIFITTYWYGGTLHKQEEEFPDGDGWIEYYYSVELGEVDLLPRDIYTKKYYRVKAELYFDDKCLPPGVYFDYYTSGEYTKKYESTTISNINLTKTNYRSFIIHWKYDPIATFVDVDGTILGTDIVEPNTLPEPPPDPKGQEEFSIYFDKWSPSLSSITSDTTYVATYREEAKSVTFISGDYGTFTVDDPYIIDDLYYGNKTPDAPSIEIEPGWELSGWSPEQADTVTISATYEAQYRGAYSVTYDIGDNGTTSDEKLFEGLEPETPTPVTPDVTPNYGSLFIGWSPEVNDTVKGNTTYAAVYIDVDDSISVEITSQEDSEYVYNLGESVAFNVTVSNDGNVDIIDLVANDSLLGNESEPFNLAVGESRQFTTFGSYVVTEDNLYGGDIALSVNVNGSTDELTTPTEASDSIYVYIGNPIPAISIVQELEKESVNAYTPVRYSICVSNTGNVTLFNGTISDDTFGFEGEFNTLAPGEEITLQGIYYSNENDIPAISNISNVNAYDIENTEVKDDDKDTIRVEAPLPSNISISITANNPTINLNNDAVYTITVVNSGFTILRDVDISSPELGFRSNISRLYVTGSKTFTVTKTMGNVGDVAISATAGGNSDRGIYVSDNDKATVTVVSEENQTSDTDLPEAEAGNEPESDSAPSDNSGESTSPTTPSDASEPTDTQDSTDTAITPPEQQIPLDTVDNPATGTIPYEIYALASILMMCLGILAFNKKRTYESSN